MTGNTDDALPPAPDVAAAMYARDDAAQNMGMIVDEVRRGYAKLSMLIAPHMLNGHNVGHGGLTFALADTALAYASNSYNQVALAQQASISWLSPTQSGERITAEAIEQNRTRRTGLYDVTVRGGDGRVVALFRGQTALIKGEVMPTGESS